MPLGSAPAPPCPCPKMDTHVCASGEGRGRAAGHVQIVVANTSRTRLTSAHSRPQHPRGDRALAADSGLYASYAHMPDVCSYRFLPRALAFRVRKSLQGRKKPGGGTGCRHPGSSIQGAGPSGPGMTRRISRALSVLLFLSPRGPSGAAAHRWLAYRAGWSALHRTSPGVDATPETGASASDTYMKTPQPGVCQALCAGSPC